ncbi:MAG: CPBP family intramembrane glutamic endopeptidase [Chloroflexota bacterium]
MSMVRLENGRITLLGIEFDIRLTLLIVFATVVPMLDYYGHSLTGTKAFDRFLYYFVGSALFIWIVYREPLRNFGFRIGDWRQGLRWTLIGCAGMALILWFVARLPDMQQFYEAKLADSMVQLTLLNGIELFGWEFAWRGLLLFGFARYFGPGPAIFLQAVPFAFMHLGKPEIETLSTIFGGAAFGFVAWKSQSFVYPWLIHWFIVTFTMFIAAGLM